MSRRIIDGVSSRDDESSLVDYFQMYPSKLTARCGEKLPNAWGLHDAHGNVGEWCWEKYADTYTYRVLRGGSFSDVTSLARSANRNNNQPDNRINYTLGFALVSS